MVHMEWNLALHIRLKVLLLELGVQGNAKKGH